MLEQSREASIAGVVEARHRQSTAQLAHGLGGYDLETGASTQYASGRFPYVICFRLTHPHPGAMTKPPKRKRAEPEVVSEVTLRRAALASAAVAHLDLSIRLASPLARCRIPP